ncbi:hypothetical protein ACF082_01080 [Streptomyces lydicus]|uniref:hypothetical protein n=1 Tax=Streptomyces lydicus TaxID=47763 RepID=UPI003700324E
MTHKTGMGMAMNETEPTTSAAEHEEDALALIREMTATVCRLTQEVQALRQDLADLRAVRMAA